MAALSADSLARLHTSEAIGTLVDVMRDPAAKHSERVAAANSVLDRGHGRPVQAVISAPARQAIAAKLAALSDDALLLLATGGGSTGGKKGDPLQGQGQGDPLTENSVPRVKAGSADDTVLDAEFIDPNEI